MTETTERVTTMGTNPLTSYLEEICGLTAILPGDVPATIPDLVNRLKAIADLSTEAMKMFHGYIPLSPEAYAYRALWHSEQMLDQSTITPRGRKVLESMAPYTPPIPRKMQLITKPLTVEQLVDPAKTRTVPTETIGTSGGGVVVVGPKIDMGFTRPSGYWGDAPKAPSKRTAARPAGRRLGKKPGRKPGRPRKLHKG